MSGSRSSATDHHSGDVTDDVTLAQLTVIYYTTISASHSFHLFQLLQMTWKVITV